MKLESTTWEAGILVSTEVIDTAAMTVTMIPADPKAPTTTRPLDVSEKVALVATSTQRTTEERLRRWRDDNRAYLAIPDPTAAESRAQVIKLTQQINALMRLVLRDLLADDTLD